MFNQFSSKSNGKCLCQMLLDIILNCNCFRIEGKLWHCYRPPTISQLVIATVCLPSGSVIIYLHETSDLTSTIWQEVLVEPAPLITFTFFVCASDAHFDNTCLFGNAWSHTIWKSKSLLKRWSAFDPKSTNSIAKARKGIIALHRSGSMFLV